MKCRIALERTIGGHGQELERKAEANNVLNHPNITIINTNAAVTAAGAIHGGADVCSCFDSS
jgi:hypothetical protein